MYYYTELMKLLSKYTFRLAVLASVALMAACEQDPKFTVYDYPVPVVENVYPTDGFVTTQVVITGTNFGDRAEAVKVFFGDIQSKKVVDCKNNRIVVEVPETAHTGDLSLQIYNKKVENIGHYTVLPTPRVITTLSNSDFGYNVADTGDKVTISGENFGTDASDISVDFNGTPAVFELVDEKTIIATAPEGYVTGNVIVTVHGYAMTGGAMFNPNSKGDVTVLYLKNYQQPFASEEDNPGDWSKPMYWNQNAASMNPHGCRQYVKNGNLTFLCFQRGWGKNAMTNGKIWQGASFLKGTYNMEITYDTSWFPNDGGNSLVAMIVPGTDESAIPDLADIATVTERGGAYTVFDDWSYLDGKNQVLTSGKLTVELTVDEAKDMVVGFLVTVGTNDTYFKVTSVKLILQ